MSPIRVGQGLNGALVVDPGGDRAFVVASGSASHEVIPIDLSAGNAQAPIKVRGEPNVVAFAP
jgi:hypothetical protein